MNNVITDIIQNLKKEKSLGQFQQTIELLKNSKFYYIITVNMVGQYSYVNEHYSTEFSYISKDFIGMPSYVSMHEDDMEVCGQVAGKCFENPDKMFPATIRKHDGCGGYLITQWEYKAMFRDDGVPEGIFCIGYDITKFVAEQQQLKQAETEIEKKSFILKEIAFQHSHLIRSPLSNILGLVSILDHMDIDIDVNVKNICKMIVESSNKLDEIIREVVGKSSDNSLSKL